MLFRSGYVFNHPESIFDAFNSVTAKLTQGQAYEENEEYFLQGINEISLKSRRTHLELVPYQGSTLKIVLAGKIPRFEQGPFIAQIDEDPSRVVVQFHEPLASNWVHININGHESSSVSDSVLNAKIYIPKTFKGLINIANVEGAVDMQAPSDKMYEFELQSNSGHIENQMEGKVFDGVKPEDVGKIKITTTSGNITIKN